MPWGKMTSFQVILFSFLGVILCGALLLSLPAATRAPGSAPFSDALFTATSAVCVTGLVVQDTAACWSPFGQFVILLLIQIGGMGVVTVAVAVAMLSGRRIGLMQRSTMRDAISAPNVGGIVRMTGFILRTALVIELLGAAALATVFCREFGPAKGLWYAVFHSVSAFCNAGFDLLGTKAPFSSLTSYAENPVINLTVMLLIVTGGIGFLTWEDVRTNGLHWRRYRMQTRAVLTAAAVLILLPALCFFFLEFSALPPAQRSWCSLFQAVTPRTAGFNTADLTRFSEPGLLLVISLMLIGGASGSTAGGMKTNTLAVLLAGARAVFTRREDAHLFGRRLADGAVRDAATLLLMYLALFLGGGAVICRLEGIPLLTALFETASAIGTVGLSLGVTPELGQISRMILIVLMYFGRVGGLTMVFAAASGRRANPARYPQEKITVG